MLKKVLIFLFTPCMALAMQSPTSYTQSVVATLHLGKHREYTYPISVTYGCYQLPTDQTIHDAHETLAKGDLFSLMESIKAWNPQYYLGLKKQMLIHAMQRQKHPLSIFLEISHLEDPERTITARFSCNNQSLIFMCNKNNKLLHYKREIDEKLPPALTSSADPVKADKSPEELLYLLLNNPSPESNS